MSSFFKNIDGVGKDMSNLNNKSIENLRARSIVVDTEEGVIN